MDCTYDLWDSTFGICSFLLSKWSFVLFLNTEVVVTVFSCKPLGLGDKKRGMNLEKKLEIKNTSKFIYKNIRVLKLVKMCF